MTRVDKISALIDYVAFKHFDRGYDSRSFSSGQRLVTLEKNGSLEDSVSCKTATPPRSWVQKIPTFFGAKS